MRAIVSMVSLGVLALLTGCGQAPAFDGVFDTTFLGQATSVHLTQTGTEITGYAQAGKVKSVLAATVDSTGQAATGTLSTILGDVRFEARITADGTIEWTHPAVGVFPGGTLTLTRRLAKGSIGAAERGRPR